MSDSFIDHLPSHEREKIRKKLRSPEAYERLRDKVKGPEDLEREMDRSEKLAELHFALESEPQVRQSLHVAMEQDLKEKGVDDVLERAPHSPDATHALEEGKFSIAVEAHPDTHEDALVILAEGNVQEKIPVKQSFSEKYASRFASKHQ